MLFGFAEEAVDDGMAVLGFREDALVFLNGEGYAMPLKPLVGVGGTELLEEAFEQGRSAWIDLSQVSHLGKSVGAVAASTARNLHLCQHFVLLFKDGDIEFGHQFLGIDGEKEARGTTANDGKGGSFTVLLVRVRH